MLKKALLGLSLLLSVIAVSCSSSGETSSRVAEGWIDANTYRAIGRGIPTSSQDPFQRKMLSKEAALLDAKDKMITRLVSSYTSTLSKSEKELVDNETIREYIAAKMRGGIIAETDWDGNENCTVTYEVTSKNLRSQVDELFVLYTKEIKAESQS